MVYIYISNIFLFYFISHFIFYSNANTKFQRNNLSTRKKHIFCLYLARINYNNCRTFLLFSNVEQPLVHIRVSFSIFSFFIGYSFIVQQFCSKIHKQTIIRACTIGFFGKEQIVASNASSSKNTDSHLSLALQLALHAKRST